MAGFPSLQPRLCESVSALPQVMDVWNAYVGNSRMTPTCPSFAADVLTQSIQKTVMVQVRSRDMNFIHGFLSPSPVFSVLLSPLSSYHLSWYPQRTLYRTSWCPHCSGCHLSWYACCSIICHGVSCVLSPVLLALLFSLSSVLVSLYVIIPDAPLLCYLSWYPSSSLYHLSWYPTGVSSLLMSPYAPSSLLYVRVSCPFSLSPVLVSYWSIVCPDVPSGLLYTLVSCLFSLPSALVSY